MNLRPLVSFAGLTVIVMSGGLLLSGFLFFDSPSHDPIPVCKPLRIESPDHPMGLERIVAEARQHQQKISLVGAGYSQGEQTCANEAIQINLAEMNQLVDLDLAQHEVTVQAGMTWKQLQEKLSVFGLSVSAMQSYADFSVGGSLGVNAHGQDVSWNPLSSSVVSLRVLLTDGRHLRVSRDENSELFRAVLGTYGLVGIITEATLKVVPNTILRKQTQLIRTQDYREYIGELSENPDLTLHSARLSINPLLRFHYAIAVNYFNTGTPAAYHKEDNTPQQTNAAYLNLIKQSWLARTARTTLEYFWAEQTGTITRNEAMGESVTTLENTVEGTRDILQEYFLPPHQLQSFIDELKQWQSKHSNFTLINATIRKVNKDTDSILPYAPQERFAIVLFINHPDNSTADEYMRQATQELIDTVIKLNGRYYLPYALYATQHQFQQAYPEYKALIKAKQEWDKSGLLTNKLGQCYLKASY